MSEKTGKTGKTGKIEKTDEEWRRELTPEQYRILREHGTERAFTGDLLDNKAEGTYRCAACGQALFESEAKYDSRSGWPSFFRPASESAVESKEDRAFGMRRTEILCSRCESHLGHVFTDGPRPTGLRYCINSASLEFDPSEAGGGGRGEAVGAPEDAGKSGGAGEGASSA